MLVAISCPILLGDTLCSLVCLLFGLLLDVACWLLAVACSSLPCLSGLLLVVWL